MRKRADNFYSIWMPEDSSGDDTKDNDPKQV